MILLWMPVDSFLSKFNDSFPPFFFVTSAEIKSTQKLNSNLFSHSTLQLPTVNYTLTSTLLQLFVTMPGPDPRKTKPSAYTIPKAGSSKAVGTRPPLHAATGASATSKEDNPRPLTHQEVRRGKAFKPAVSRASARLLGARRSPAPALKSRVANLKRPDKYDPKSSINLTQLGSKSSRLVARQAPPTIPRHTESPCLLYTSPSPRDRQKSRMPSSA